jgi:CsoR family transcriptional regulator, copper-sensing transcriptional repressor
MLHGAVKTKVENRLKRVEGQVAGIRRMVDEGKYCVDILTQLAAAQAALRAVGNLVLSQHVETCVSDALRGGDDGNRREKLDELLEVFARFNR